MGRSIQPTHRYDREAEWCSRAKDDDPAQEVRDLGTQLMQLGTAGLPRHVTGLVACSSPVILKQPRRRLAGEFAGTHLAPTVLTELCPDISMAAFSGTPGSVRNTDRREWAEKSSTCSPGGLAANAYDLAHRVRRHPPATNPPRSRRRKIRPRRSIPCSSFTPARPIAASTGNVHVEPLRSSSRHAAEPPTTGRTDRSPHMGRGNAGWAVLGRRKRRGLGRHALLRGGRSQRRGNADA